MQRNTKLGKVLTVFKMELLSDPHLWFEGDK